MLSQYFTSKNTKRLIQKEVLSKLVYLEIIIHGLNFHLKRIKMYRPKYYLDFHKSEILIMDEKPAENYKSRIYKRRLLLCSYNSQKITRISKLIKQFKQPDEYTGKGVIFRNELYKIKPGKSTKR